MFKILKDLGSIAENINQTPYNDDSSVSYLIERNNKEHSIDNTISHKKNLIKEYNKISEKSGEITKQKEKEF